MRLVSKACGKGNVYQRLVRFKHPLPSVINADFANVIADSAAFEPAKDSREVSWMHIDCFR